MTKAFQSAPNTEDIARASILPLFCSLSVLYSFLKEMKL